MCRYKFPKEKDVGFEYLFAGWSKKKVTFSLDQTEKTFQVEDGTSTRLEFIGIDSDYVDYYF